MIRLKLACAVALALVACNKDAKQEAAKTDPAAAPAPTTKEAPAAAAPAPAPAPAGGGTADNSDPGKVVEQIFSAANTGKADALAGLCDPAGTGDGDVKSVCASKPGDPTWERFARDFKTGKLDGAPAIEGDTAAVTFLFGKDGTRKETMNLTKIDGKWYLASF
jgi:hypothetical protein